MAKKFDTIRETIAALEVAAAHVAKLRVSTVTSQDDARVQVSEVLSLFRRLKINHHVTAKVGLWFKRTPMVDVLIGYPEGVTASNGSEAYELSTLMTQAMRLVRTIIETAIPGMTNFTPKTGAVCNGWRFQ